MEMKLSEIVINSTTTTKQLKEIYRDNEKNISQDLMLRMVSHVNADARLLSWISERNDLGKELVELLFHKRNHLPFEKRLNFLQEVFDNEMPSSLLRRKVRGEISRMTLMLIKVLKDPNTKAETLKRLCEIKAFPMELIELMVKHPNADDRVLKKFARTIIYETMEITGREFEDFSFEEMPEFGEMVNKEVMKRLKDQNLSEDELWGLYFLKCLSPECCVMLFKHPNAGYCMMDEILDERNPQVVATLISDKELPVEIRHYIMSDLKESPVVNDISAEDVLAVIKWKFEDLEQEMKNLESSMEELVKDSETSSSKLYDIFFWARSGLSSDTLLAMIAHQNLEQKTLDFIDEVEEGKYQDMHFLLGVLETYRTRRKVNNMLDIANIIKTYYGEWSQSEKDMLMEKIRSGKTGHDYYGNWMKYLWGNLPYSIVSAYE